MVVTVVKKDGYGVSLNGQLISSGHQAVITHIIKIMNDLNGRTREGSATVILFISESI